MSRPYRAIFLLTFPLFALGLLTAGRAGDKAPEGIAQPRAFAKLQRGMTPEEVRTLVGSPKRIARQIFYHRYREQWMYDAPISIRLTFDCRRGQKPELLTPPTVPNDDARTR